uniref:Uncharacterized protein n=1 Tax=Clytia hemisphaerica TaxID=252671 RepID=A0A7M5WR43_9CNID|eukprot:TCONS_00065639-protein
MKQIPVLVFLTLAITLNRHGTDTFAIDIPKHRHLLNKRAGISCKEDAELKCAGQKTPAEFKRCWKRKVKNCKPDSELFGSVSRYDAGCEVVQVEKEEYLYFEGQYYKVLYKEPVLICL